VCPAATPTSEADAKAESSDPLSLPWSGKRLRNQATPGITESWHLRVQIAGAVCYLDVDSAHPPGAHAGKGPAVRRLRSHVSWVQYVAKQYFLYLLRRMALKFG